MQKILEAVIGLLSTYINIFAGLSPLLHFVLVILLRPSIALHFIYKPQCIQTHKFRKGMLTS